MWRASERLLASASACRRLYGDGELPQWLLQLVQVQPGTVSLCTRPYVVSGTSSSASASGRSEERPTTIPVRGVVAKKVFARGERVCVIPRRHILTGERADHLLRASLHSSATASAVSGSASRGGTDSVSSPSFSVRWRPYAELVKGLGAVAEGSSLPPTELCATRDAQLLTLTLFLLRHLGDANASSSSSSSSSLLPSCTVPQEYGAFQQWVRHMPRRTPPLGMLLHHYYNGRAQSERQPLQRRVRVGPRTVPLLPGQDPSELAMQLVLAAVEGDENSCAGGDSTVLSTSASSASSGLDLFSEQRRPHTEVVLTPTMLTNYYEGKQFALTPRQYEAATAHVLRQGSQSAVQQLIQLENTTETHVLRPLLQAIVAGCGGEADADVPHHRHSSNTSTEELLCELRWAHFMTRSRALNVLWRQGPSSSSPSGSPAPTQMALIPFLDLLNHTFSVSEGGKGGGGGNVLYHLQPSSSSISTTTSAPHDDDDGAVVVTARRRIEIGEELALHYGHHGQRGSLFAFDAEGTPKGGGGAGGIAAAKKARVDQEVRALEAAQRREITFDEDEDTSSGQRAPSLMRAVMGSGEDSTVFYRAPQGGANQTRLAELEAKAEATWLWRYGFCRSPEERAYEASMRWSRGLRQRMAHLTDARRKGRPGEFVVGVPEGLEQLREQRERLERERYGNKTIFPPQRG